MDTYKDYPAAAKANAKKAIDWKEKYGRDVVKGGTEVGWQRAHQLAKGEALSRDVVSRMAQFNRHRKNSKVAPEFKDEPWRDSGYIAWLIWGGDEGVDWAMNKMDQIKKQEANESMKHIKLFEAFVNEAEIPGANYLTPSKKEIDSWKKKDAMAWLDQMNDESYGHQQSNRASDLRSTDQAIEAVTKYLQKKGLLKEAKGKDLIQVKKLDWVDHTRLIKFVSKEFGKLDVTVNRTGGYTIDPSGLSDAEVEILLDYLKSQKYLV